VSGDCTLLLLQQPGLLPAVVALLDHRCPAVLEAAIAALANAANSGDPSAVLAAAGGAAACRAAERTLRRCVAAGGGRVAGGRAADVETWQTALAQTVRLLFLLAEVRPAD
jgi:NAD(P)H-dependent FMN reductase